MADPRWHQLKAAFSAELEERVRDLNHVLLRLEQSEGAEPGDRSTFDALFREAHSLKGAARAVGLGDLERLAHAIESALDSARRRAERPPPHWFDAVYRAVDMLGTLGGLAGDEGDGPTPPQLTDVLAGLDAVTTAPSPAPSPLLPQPPTAPAPPPEPSPPSEVGPREAAARVAPESVRVAVDKLDRLLAQAGELAVTQIRIEQRLSELRELRRELQDWRREWRGARSLRVGLRRATAPPGPGRGTGALATEAPLDDALRRELRGLLRFTERAEEHAQAFLRRVDELATQFRQDTAQLGLVGHAIEEDVMAARLVTVGSIFGPFERMVRDLARHDGKDVQLILEGGETEVDRKIVEQIRDPLLHMLRNAVDHGIEPADARVAQGKPRAGTIRVAASQRGSVVEIEVSDDGVGLDPSGLRLQAVQKGLLSEEQASALDDRSAIDLIFQPGFSTSPAVTETSGRGVGMDVVREHVERLNGQVEVTRTPGRGTRFTLRVPLTLATSRAILVEQGGQLFAVPSDTVERTARARARELLSLEGRRVVVIEGVPVPVVDLARALEQPPAAQSARDADAWRPLFVLRQGDRRFAFLVEQLVGEQEIVVKSLGWPLRRVRNVGGATILGSGHAVMILNPADLFKTAAHVHRTTDARATPVAQPDVPRRRVLVVDDSLTTRTLERSILEAAGYQVSVATDGLDALSRLRAEPIDLVVSDIEMPRLNGFGLTAELRRDAGLRNMPVILVTSLDDRDHREQGVAAGADAYIVKSGFDQAELLETIRRLL